MKYIIALNIDDHIPAWFPFKAVGRLQKLKELLQQIYYHLFYTYIGYKEIHLLFLIYIIMEGGQTRNVRIEKSFGHGRIRQRDVYLKFFIRSDPFSCPSQFQGITIQHKWTKWLTIRKGNNNVWPHRSESLSYWNLCMYFGIHLIRILLFGPFKLMKDLIGIYRTKTFSFFG